MIDVLRRHVWLVILAAFLVTSIGLGIRQNFGLMLPAMTADLGIDRQTFKSTVVGILLSIQRIQQW